MAHKPIDPQGCIERMWELAPRLAKAKGERVYMEEYRKSLKSILMRASHESSAVAQERDAYADDQYIKHLAGLRAAVEQEEALKWQMTALEAAIETWRSQEASNRAIDKAAR